MSVQKVLTTGVTGFIGSNLVLPLFQQGRQIIGIEDLNDLNDLEIKHARLANLGIDKQVKVVEALERGSFQFL